MIHSYLYRSVLLVLLLSLSRYASAGIVLGYCGDKIASSGLSNANLDAEISCAMALPPAKLSDYTICSISELHIGLSETEGITGLKVWVRNHLTSDDLASVEVPASELIQGWNTIQLPSMVEINGSDTLFCGYSYTQEAKVKCISYNGAKKTPNSFFISNGTIWGDYTKSYGPVSIRAGVQPNHDNAVKLTDIRLDRRSQQYIEEGASYLPITITGTLQNVGRLPLSYFVVESTDYSSATESFGFDCQNEVPFGESTTFHYTIVPGQHVTHPACDIPIGISIVKPNDDESALLINCQDTLYYELGEASFMPDMAHFIIEEFTSEECGYAPIGQQRLRDAIELAHKYNLGNLYQEWLDGNVDGYYTTYTIISRHEGYGPADYWRVSRGSDYQPNIFGKDELTFAPAMTINRSHIPYSTTINADSLGRIIADYHTPNVVSLWAKEGSISYDAASRKLSVDVDVALWSAAFCQNPRIILCVKQDKAESYNQKNYYPETYDASYQYDVICSFLSCKSGSNELYPGIDMNGIISGQLPIGEESGFGEYGDVHRTYSFEGTLPIDIQSLDGLTLVGYVCDQAIGGRIYGSFSCPLDR